MTSTSGASESISASASPVTVFVAPGPEVTRQTPTCPLTRRIALCSVHGALLVADEDVAQAVAVVVKGVVDPRMIAPPG